MHIFVGFETTNECMDIDFLSAVSLGINKILNCLLILVIAALVPLEGVAAISLSDGGAKHAREIVVQLRPLDLMHVEPVKRHQALGPPTPDQAIELRF